MLANIWLSSAFIVIAIFSAGAMYKSYSDIREAKNIQEHYEIVSEIKTLIAKQYNKNPTEITRDEIIAHLPLGENWEKVLLLDRNKDSNISNKEFVNKDGNIVISTDEKLKLLALRTKLKDKIDLSTVNAVNGKYTYEVGINNKNEIIKDAEIQKALKRAILHLIYEVLYGPNTDYAGIIKFVLDNFTPIKNIYQDLRTQSEISSNTTLSDEVLELRKKDYFQQLIKKQLLKNQNAEETKLYFVIKDLL